jgi:hypothetical protein
MEAMFCILLNIYDVSLVPHHVPSHHPTALNAGMSDEELALHGAEALLITRVRGYTHKPQQGR